MEYTKKDIETIESILSELRIYRLEDEEPREMAVDGLYYDEYELMGKLGIKVENL